ncbi:MAG: hypothetical protein ABFD46_00115 [Armatimonadota bacterium]
MDNMSYFTRRKSANIPPMSESIAPLKKKLIKDFALILTNTLFIVTACPISPLFISQIEQLDYITSDRDIYRPRAQEHRF